MATLPTGTVTFLFSDIEGSTVLWEHAPEQMRIALARYDALVEQSITAHNGVLVRPRGEGDSHFAVFARASDAVVAAAALQQAICAETWSTPTPLYARMALHTGEADHAPGAPNGDYYGAAVNRCARLRAIAHGGQVLLSCTVADLLDDHLPPGVRLRDLGAHRLKDIHTPEHVFQLLAEGIPADFPPLQTQALHLNNLPNQPTPFIGHERDVALVRDQLLQPEVRLITLTGPGGTGKTRLALRVAAGLLESALPSKAGQIFADGIWFVDLAPIRAPDLVTSTIAQTLEIREIAGRPQLDILKEALHDRQLLLLLDNFEQVVSAATSVAELLAACPEVKALVTSRIPLHLRGEHEIAVTPLSLPDPAVPPMLEQITQYEAVQLFIARARDAKPDFSVTNANAAAIAEICVRLDGLPLAIELAAARVRLFPPQALLARLSHRLITLTGGARDLPARQQTLRDAIDWSFHLLRPNEQRLFARMAIFEGGCTLEAAAAVCGDTAPETLAVLDDLQTLVEHSLLYRVELPASLPAGETRVRMLETIREYALECLQAHHETEALRQRHATYYLSFAEGAASHLVTAAQRLWLDLIEAEHDNLRAALAWSLRSASPAEQAELGLQLVGMLWRFWFLRGYFEEWDRWHALALERCPTAPPLLRARALAGRAMCALYETDIPQMARYGADCLALARAAGEQTCTIIALAVVGWAEYCAGEKHNAYQRLAQSVELARALHDPWLIAWALLRQVDLDVRAHGGNTTLGPLLDESLELARAAGDPWLIAWALDERGFVAWLNYDLAAARASYNQCLALRRELGDRLGVAWATSGLASVALSEGDIVVSRRYQEERLAMERQLGNRQGIAATLTSLGEVALIEQNLEQATAYLEQSVPLHQATGNTHNVAAARYALGLAALLQDDLDTAWNRWYDCYTFCEAQGGFYDHAAMAWLALALGQLVLLQGKSAEATSWFDRGVTHARATDMLIPAAIATCAQGFVAFQAGEVSRARTYFADGLRICGELIRTERILATARCLEGVASLAGSAGYATWAACLFATASAMRDSTGIAAEEVYRLWPRSVMTRLRATMEPRAWEQAWDKGLALSPEDALLAGLEERTRPEAIQWKLFVPSDS